MPARARTVAATGDADAGTDVLEERLFSGPQKGRFGVAKFSTRFVSAGSQLTAVQRGVGRRRPVWARAVSAAYDA
jgi:hypothetical protein